MLYYEIIMRPLFNDNLFKFILNFVGIIMIGIAGVFFASLYEYSERLPVEATLEENK